MLPRCPVVDHFGYCSQMFQAKVSSLKITFKNLTTYCLKSRINRRRAGEFILMSSLIVFEEATYGTNISFFPFSLSWKGSRWETWMFGWKRKWVRTLWSIMEWAQCLATIEGRSVCRSRCSWSNQNKPCLGNTRQKPGYIRFTPHQIARRFGCSTIVD